MYRTFLQYLRRKSATEWSKEPLLLKCLGFDELQTEFHAGGMKRNCLIWGTIVLTASVCASFILHAADAKSEAGWKTLPLIKDGKVDPAWVHVGYGGFVVD